MRPKLGVSYLSILIMSIVHVNCTFWIVYMFVYNLKLPHFLPPQLNPVGLEEIQRNLVFTIQSGLLDKFQYCDSNIELFSIAPPLVIAHPTLR